MMAINSSSPKPIVILFLGANPSSTTRLRLDQEVRAIDQALRQANYRDHFDLRQHWAVRVADLQELLLRHQPHIVHFSGHGSQAGQLILEDDHGREFAVPPDALSRLFAILRDRVRCVVLNACYSEPQAQAIAAHIDCVIGMPDAIGDAASLHFAASFYQALAYGRDVQTAFDLGCNQIDLQALDEPNKPRLLAQRCDPRQVLFVAPGEALGAPASDVDAALALLATLPLDELPAIAPLPPGSRMPFSANPLFVGRADDLRALAKILKGGATAAVGQVAAATGLGGIGKTQLAVEFAHRYGRFFAGGVYWLSCSDPNAVSAEVVACGLAMGLPAFEALDFPDQVRRVQQAWQEPISRLLIFDNCEEEEVLAQWRPATGGCRVLVTGRRASWSAGLGVRSLALPVLPRAESVALLRRFREDLAEGDPVLDAISGELGDLPLALHLAGSFLARHQYGVTPAAYLDDLRRPDLLAHRSLVAGDWSPTGHEAHVARTVALSYKGLDGSDVVDGLALALLARLACFAPGEPVPRELLLLALHRDVDGPDYEASDALRRLVELGLVDGQEDGAVVMHRLVAAFVLALPGAEEVQGAVEVALGWEANRVNLSGFPARLLPWQGHLRYVTDRALSRGDVQAAWLCSELGPHLNQAGDLPAARPYLEQALAIRRKTLGEAHPDTATSLNNLGMLLENMGDLPAAKPYLEQALAIRRQALGEAHPDTATSLNNLGGLLYDMGDLPAAKPYLEQALVLTRQALGEAHPDTARSLNNLGSLLYAMGDLPAARPYFEQALAIKRQALGEDHPDTAQSLNNLGSLLRAMGDLPAAKPYLEQALAIRHNTLGDGHPDTATSLNNLGSLLYAMGDLPAVKSYLEQAVAILERSLGPNHPNTQTVRRNLQDLLDEMGSSAAPSA